MNQIKKIEHLESLKELKDLDLSFNFIEKAEGLESLNHLSILKLNNNKIKYIKQLKELNSLTILNLSNNMIRKGLWNVKNISNLTHLYIKGNPVCQILTAFWNLSKNSSVQVNSGLNLLQIIFKLQFIDILSTDMNSEAKQSSL